MVLPASAMVEELGDAFEALDLNPIKILPQGKGAWAVDALCVLRGSHHLARGKEGDWQQVTKDEST